MDQIDANKVWQNFMDTVTNHYMDFSGRVGRSQFWFFVLVCVGIEIIAAIISSIFIGGLISSLVGLALLLPTGGMAARRIQDTGRNAQFVWIWILISAVFQLISLMGSLSLLYFFLMFGWLYSLISLVVLVVSIAIIYFCAQLGTPGDNAYGPPPAPWTPGAVKP
ncbi:MAG TPA: DUF805 domain-containing protein [Rhizomicrobium sp.]|jgi:uncharacterized membrane protein YhaH (DUF805 family)